MKNRIAGLILFCAALVIPASAQQFFPGAGGITVVTVLPATCSKGSQYLFNGQLYVCNPANTLTPITANAIVSSGLIGQFPMTVGSTVAALPDTSGLGNNATGTVGTAPTIATVTGGLVCGGVGGVILPTALNGALTIQFFLGFQPPISSPLSILNAPIMGNGNGAASNASGIVLFSSVIADAWSAQIQGGARIRTFSPGNTFQASTLDTFVGNQVLTWTMSTLDHVFINNTEATYIQAGAPSAGLNTFPFQLCGAAAGSGNSSQTYFTGTIYYALFYNRVLSAAEIAQNVAAMQQTMASRGVIFSASPTDNKDQSNILGDSISAGLGWPVGLSLFPTTPNWNVADQGVPGQTLLGLAPSVPTSINQLSRPLATKNISIIWAGSNDSTIANFNYMRSMSQQAKSSGQKVLVATMISRSGQDGYKNSLNALTRSLWPTFADGLCDFASNVGVGADGAFSNGNFTDGVHLSAAGNALITTMGSTCINRTFGNTQASSNFTTVKVGATMKPMFRVPANKIISAGQSAGTTLTALFPVVPLGKSLLAGSVSWTGAGITISSVTDTSGDTCAAIGSASNYFATQNFQMWFCQNVTNSAQTVTVNLSGAGSGPGGAVEGVEVVGILNTASPVDISSPYATGNSSTPVTAAVTTTVAGDMLIASGIDFGLIYLPNPKYVEVFGSQDSTVSSILGNTSDASVTGNYTAGYTVTNLSNLWSIGLTAFKPAVFFSPYTMTAMDVYTQVDPTGGPVVLNMIDAVGITGGTVTIQNIGTTSASAVTLTPLGSETINSVTGASAFTIPNGSTAVCTSVLVSPVAAGANWQCVASLTYRSPYSTLLTSGVSWTSPALLQSTSQVKITMIGGGNSGGTSGAATIGLAAGSGCVIVAQGTAATLGLAANTAYTIAIGNATGGSTTFNNGSVTNTAAGGTAGSTLSSAAIGDGLGGVGGSCTTNIPGSTGYPGNPGGTGQVIVITTTYQTGQGGTTPLGYGVGGQAVISGIAGKAATGFGAGGSGGGVGTQAGGVGTAGAIIIEITF